eukprot:1179821-Prorocentrum_minimum.AAC.4
MVIVLSIRFSDPETGRSDGQPAPLHVRAGLGDGPSHGRFGGGALQEARAAAAVLNCRCCTRRYRSGRLLRPIGPS